VNAVEGEVGLGQWAVAKHTEVSGEEPEPVAELSGEDGLESRARELREELTEALRELELLRAEQRRLVVLEGGLGRPEAEAAEEVAEPEPLEQVAPSDVPEGVLVPLDAWQRMLQQLGNLHEAGQQLAEARERAAKAETEAGFLRERVRDLRGELERAKGELAAALRPAPADEGVRPRRFWRRRHG
jgi:hypothetical protein